MEELELRIREHILDREITSIKVFNVNDSYVEFIPEVQWVVDGGIQFEFGNQTMCIGWNFENEGFYFSTTKPIAQILGETPFYQIEPSGLKGISKFIGAQIKDLRIKWEFYHEFDEEGELKSEKIYTPVGLLLEFDFNEFIQIAEIGFEVDHQKFAIINAEYNIFGRLLLSVNKKVEISEC